ncbi:MAG: hypothetical protein KGI50_06015 [Patescibacteria group bacterium]|nr:hypothetical protein [Patescibacteria group bacterium]
MSRKNTLLLNFAGGEISPQVYGREDLPAYQKGWQRIQNYEVLPQGAARFRNGFVHVHNTNGLASGRLIPFTFNEVDTYILEFTNKALRFYRNFGAVMNTATVSITGISNASPCVVTAPAHGYSNGQEIFISGIVGMPQVNGQYFLISNVTTNTFQLNNIFNAAINSTSFSAYSSGGTIQTPYQISTPYAVADLSKLQFAQSADTVYITHPNYAPYKLTRSALTSWTLNFFTRTADPFNQQVISSASNANPGVFTTAGNHNMTTGDTVYIDGLAGGTWATLNGQTYTVTVTGATTFTIGVNTTALGIYTGSSGISIDTLYCPVAVAFLGSSRLMYANWGKNPGGFAGSELPDPTTGNTQYDNFTTGANANNAFIFTVAPVFNQQDAISWITSNNSVVVLGCANSMRIVTGSGGPGNAITPSSIEVTPISNVGAASVQPYSNGMTVFYIDQTTSRLASFAFNIQIYNYMTQNQNLLANHLGASPFVQIAEQRRESSLLWVLRQDGVLLGLTFDEVESVYGWHRHYIGGQSSAANGRANVLSIAVEPKLNQDSVLWAIVERQQANGNTYRSVEYWALPTKWRDFDDYFSGTASSSNAGMQSDLQLYQNAVYEQQKKDLYLDGANIYDGSQQAAGVTITPSATSGSITLTASSNFFTTSMVNQQIWKAYDSNGNGGGRIQITNWISATQVQGNVLVNLDNSNVIPSGSWYLSAATVYGMLNFAGETLTLQCDGAPSGGVTVGSDGSIALQDQASYVQAGYPFLGMLTSLNIDAGGDRGPAQAKWRKLRQARARFVKTVGARVGTDKWSTYRLPIKDQSQVADRPTALFDGVLDITVDDSWDQTKQIVILQDIPSPQTVIGIDVMMDTSDP